LSEFDLELSEDLKRFVELCLRVHRKHCEQAFGAKDWHVWLGDKARAEAIVDLLHEVSNSLKDQDQRQRFRRHMQEARAGLFQSMFFGECGEDAGQVAELKKENEMLMDRLAKLRPGKGE
jgi:hypothetical protein